MDIKSSDPRDNLRHILEEYKITPYTFGLISGLDEEVVSDFANHKTALVHLPVARLGPIVTMIGLLSDGMTAVTEDERVKAIIEVLHDDFQISHETISLYAKMERTEVEEFISGSDTLSFEKRYRLAVVVLFLFKILSKSQ